MTVDGLLRFLGITIVSLITLERVERGGFEAEGGLEAGAGVRIFFAGAGVWTRSFTLVVVSEAAIFFEGDGVVSSRGIMSFAPLDGATCAKVVAVDELFFSGEDDFGDAAGTVFLLDVGAGS